MTVLTTMVALLVVSGTDARAAYSSQLHMNQTDAAAPKGPEVLPGTLLQASEAQSLGKKAAEIRSFRSGTNNAVLVATQGAEAVLPLLLVAALVGATIWLLWHNKWNVDAAVDEGKHYAGRAAVTAW